MNKNSENKNKSIINYDPSTDALYVVTREGEEEEFVEISAGINVELDSQGRVIGIEILNASKALSTVIEPLYRKSHKSA